MSDKNPLLPSDDRTFTEELFGAELFWAKNKTKILLGAVALVVVLAAIAAWIINDFTQKREAEKAFAEAMGPADWEVVIERFPGTNPAAAASLLLAAHLREEGDSEAATRQYELFLKTFPENPLTGLARLGLAQNALAAGSQDSAVEELRLTAATADPFAAPMALFLEAANAISNNNYKEARKALDSLMSQFPDSLPARFAPAQIQQINLVEPPAKADP